VHIVPQGVASGLYQYLLVYANDKYTYEAQIGIENVKGSWAIVSFTPPDFAQAGASVNVNPQLGRVPPLTARQAAERFVLQYGNYAEQATRKAPTASKTVLNQIDAGGDPLVGLAPIRRPVKLLSISFGPLSSGQFAATAQLSDSGINLPQVTFTMGAVNGAWVATAFVTNATPPPTTSATPTQSLS
jgi:hypothetical protein